MAEQQQRGRPGVGRRGHGARAPRRPRSSQTQRRFKDGTYASRIRFTDSPTSGKDGDHVNETFFAIGPQQRFDFDPDFSELDFTEYLPNGGWGATGPIAYQTSYNGYRLDPWDPHNAHSQQTRSLERLAHRGRRRCRAGT